MHNKNICPAQRIAVIGAGAVGATAAYTLMVKNLAAEVMLVDVNLQKEEGEVMDIDDVLCFVESGQVKGATFKDAAKADIIILTAGAAQKPGETRLDLVNKNKAITKSVFESIGKIKPTAIIVVVANPVDIITYLAQELSGLPKNQVFGTGTALDTARLRSELSQKLGIYAQNVDGFILGEHGDSEFAAWSTVTVGGRPAKDLGLSAGDLDLIEKKVKTAAYEIINRKGATFYGIALTVSDVVEAILFDQHKIMPASVRLENWNGISGVCLGVPAVIGRDGVEDIWPVGLSKEEIKKFKNSAETIKKFL